MPFQTLTSALVSYLINRITFAELIQSVFSCITIFKVVVIC